MDFPASSDIGDMFHDAGLSHFPDTEYDYTDLLQLSQPSDEATHTGSNLNCSGDVITPPILEVNKKECTKRVQHARGQDDADRSSELSSLDHVSTPSTRDKAPPRPGPRSQSLLQSLVRNAALGDGTQPIQMSKEWKLPPRPARGRKPKDACQGTKRNKSRSGAPRAKPQRRGPLAPETKRLAAIKRQFMLICVICHLKKESCTLDESSPDGPCLRCKSRVMPCVRYRIPDTALYREQKAPYFMFTQRWKSMDLIDITHWATDETRTIELSLGLLDAPYQVKVKQFIPMTGDSLEEIWTKNGEVVSYPLPPYGIVNMAEAAKSVGAMIERQVGSFLVKIVGGFGSHSLIWETYLAAFKRANSATTPREQALLFDTLRLWVVCRITSHPEYIVGDEKLSTPAVDDPESPYFGNVLTSPVLNAQLECIYYSQFLRPLSKNVLRSLMELLDSKERRYWYTIYLALFMILHSSSMTARRDKEHASTISLPTTYCNTDSIRQQSAGSTTLLAHYHLGLKGAMPFKLALQGRMSNDSSLGVSEQDVAFITRSATLAAKSKPKWDQIRASGSWENDFFWISQLFDDGWKPEKMD